MRAKVPHFQGPTTGSCRRRRSRPPWSPAAVLREDAPNGERQVGDRVYQVFDVLERLTESEIATLRVVTTCATALVLVTSSTSALCAASLPTAPELVRRYYQAVGGYARLKAVHSLRLRGAYTEGTFVARTVMERQRPNLRVVNVGGYCEGYDGAAWEHNTHSQKIARTSGAAAAATRRGAEFDESFVDAAPKHTKVEVVGERALGAKRVWLLRATLRDGWRKDYYMDERTGLVSGLVVSMPIHAHGKPVTSISLYDRYRWVNGVLFAFRQIERNVETGAIINVLQWTDIEVNPRLDAADFHPPCRLKKLAAPVNTAGFVRGHYWPERTFSLHETGLSRSS